MEDCFFRLRRKVSFGSFELQVPDATHARDALTTQLSSTTPLTLPTSPVSSLTLIPCG